MKLLKGIKKLLFVFLLLASNIYLVAYDSILKYMQGGIVIEVSTKQLDGLTAPAITIGVGDT